MLCKSPQVESIIEIELELHSWFACLYFDNALALGLYTFLKKNFYSSPNIMILNALRFFIVFHFLPEFCFFQKAFSTLLFSHLNLRLKRFCYNEVVSKLILVLGPSLIL